MNIYTNDGWLNAEEIINQPEPLTFVVGARGIGKTYGFIKYFVERGIPFIYMRRTQIETDLQGDERTTSLKKIFNDLGITDLEYKPAGKGKLHVINQIITDQEGNQTRRNICMCVPMSTMAGIRGFDFSDYQYGIYDEFITEPHVKALRQEGNAVAAAYETINRNREIEGYPAFKLFCLANSLNIANDVFMVFGLIEPAEALINAPDEKMIYRRQNILLIIPKNSPISRKKESTALYSEVSEEYAKMAIRNEFILNDFTYVKKLNLNEYKCKFNVGSLFIYEHKNKREYYCTFTRGETKIRYTDSYADLIRMQRERMKYWMRYLDGKIRFDSYRAIALFEKYYSAK